MKVFFPFLLLPTFSFQHLTEDFLVTHKNLFIQNKGSKYNPNWAEFAGMLQTVEVCLK